MHASTYPDSLNLLRVERTIIRSKLVAMQKDLCRTAQSHMLTL